VDTAALDAWRDRPVAQQPDWPDPAVVTAVTSEIARIPPLVFAGECDILKERMAAVARGEAFVLQGGDCAETFDGSTANGTWSLYIVDDANGDVGPNHYFQYINNVATIYDKNGQVVLGPFAGNAFWSLAMARELDDLILHLRANEEEIGLWVLRTSGRADAVAYSTWWLIALPSSLPQNPFRRCVRGCPTRREPARRRGRAWPAARPP